MGISVRREFYLEVYLVVIISFKFNIMRVIFFFFCLIIIGSCSKDDEVKNINVDKNESFNLNGYVQKGPFTTGSKVTISELNDKLEQTGKTYTTSITKDNGWFELSSIALESRYIQINVDGFFFNEVLNKLSESQISLFAISDVEDNTSINVNIITNILKPRMELLISSGSSFKEAKTQSLEELFKCFSIDYEGYADNFDLTEGNDEANALIAISAISIINRNEAQLTELLSNIARDFKDNGILDSQDLISALAFSSNLVAQKGNIENFKSNLIERYKSLGVDITIGDFSKYIDADHDGISNLKEILDGTDLNSGDSDDDGMPDLWENENGFNAVDGNDASQDSDSDGLTNLEEYELSSNPRSEDTDADGMADKWELDNDLNLLDMSDADMDNDADLILNKFEYEFDLDPNVKEYSIPKRVYYGSVSSNDDLSSLILYTDIVGDVDIYSDKFELPFLETIDGDFSLGGVKEVNLQNLKKVSKKFNLHDSYISDFKGLSSLEEVGSLVLYINFELTSLDGLESLKSLIGENEFLIQIFDNDKLRDYCAITDLVLDNKDKVYYAESAVDIFKPTIQDYEEGNCKL